MDPATRPFMLLDSLVLGLWRILELCTEHLILNELEDKNAGRNLDNGGLVCEDTEEQGHKKELSQKPIL